MRQKKRMTSKERGGEGDRQEERQTEPEKWNKRARQTVELSNPSSQGFHSQGNKALMRDKYSVTEVSAWLT